MQNKIYIAVISIVFLGITIVFDFFPRSTFSELEKRDLTTFPVFTWDALASGDFTTNINSWFSDTEPYRDLFLSMSMAEKDWINLSVSDDDVTFHASNTAEEAEEEEKQPTAEELEKGERTVTRAKTNSNAEENATIANRGIIVVGKGEKTRALMAFGGKPNGGTAYSEICNKYKTVFPDVNVYCMVIPTATDFYVPEKVKSATNEQLPTISNIYAHLDSCVHAVNVYTPLSEHASEDIYLRTDHHWAPLGAYYAAQKFAQVAGVPFKTLESYTKKVIHGYVGSMYGYSKDIALKNNPEDFVYYVPNNIDYKTTYNIYRLDPQFNIVGEYTHEGPFFMQYGDGSRNAYSTFMGGDCRITKVQTATKNSRRLIIIKDSFGNAIPGYLFYSFEEIHVIDERYFTKNMKKYVADNKIVSIR